MQGDHLQKLTRQATNSVNVTYCFIAAVFLL